MLCESFGYGVWVIWNTIWVKIHIKSLQDFSFFNLQENEENFNIWICGLTYCSRFLSSALVTQVWNLWNILGIIGGRPIASLLDSKAHDLPKIPSTSFLYLVLYFCIFHRYFIKIMKTCFSEISRSLLKYGVIWNHLNSFEVTWIISQNSVIEFTWSYLKRSEVNGILWKSLEVSEIFWSLWNLHI